MASLDLTSSSKSFTFPALTSKVFACPHLSLPLPHLQAEGSHLGARLLDCTEGRTWHDPSPPPPPAPCTPLLSLSKANSNQRNVCMALWPRVQGQAWPGEPDHPGSAQRLWHCSPGALARTRNVPLGGVSSHHFHPASFL